MTALPAAPGDVLAVAGGGAAGWLVRAGELIAGKPSVDGHVAIVTHKDAKGRWVGIQGAPGGVGPVDCTPFLTHPLTRSNHAQPRANDHGQLTTFLAASVKSLGIAYDWAGIAGDAIAALHIPDLSAEIDELWRWPSDKGLLPGHVVCSSLAAMLYALPQISWKHPDLGTERYCLPSDWADWSAKQQWLKP